MKIIGYTVAFENATEFGEYPSSVARWYAGQVFTKREDAETVMAAERLKSGGRMKFCIFAVCEE